MKEVPYFQDQKGKLVNSKNVEVNEMLSTLWKKMVSFSRRQPDSDIMLFSVQLRTIIPRTGSQDT